MYLLLKYEMSALANTVNSAKRRADSTFLTLPLPTAGTEGGRAAHAQKLKAVVCMTCTDRELTEGCRRRSASGVWEVLVLLQPAGAVVVSSA